MSTTDRARTRPSARERLAALACVVAMAATLAVAPSAPTPPRPPEAPFRVAAALHDPASLDACLRRLADLHTDRARYRIAGRSVEGRPISGIEVGSRDPAAPAVFIHAGLHGREWTSHVVALNVVRRLLHTKSAELLSRLRVCVVPLANPDGYAWSRTAARPQGPHGEALWRKSRRPIGAGRLRAVGVDLNRNFDVEWARLGSATPDANDYRGAHPASEPEVDALQRLILEEPRVFGLDVHSGAPYQIHAPSRADRTEPFGDEIVELAVTMRAAFREAPAPSRFGGGRGGRFVFEASPGGQAVNFLRHRAGAQAFTVEIGRFFDGVAAPERAEVVGAWVESILAALRTVARGPGISGRVVDAATGRPLPAEVTITPADDEAPRANRLGRPLPTCGREARFARYLAPGRYRIAVEAPGRAPHSEEIELRRTTGWRRLAVEMIARR